LDIWALGITLYSIIKEVFPFKGYQSAKELYEMIGNVTEIDLSGTHLYVMIYFY